MKVEIDIPEKPNTKVEDRKVNCSADVYLLKEVQAIKNAAQEHFIFIGMDNGNNVRCINLIGIGHNNHVFIDSKDIARTALLNACDKVIFVHNHPSKKLEPSNQDKELTIYCNKMLSLFNIKVEDHIIVTKDNYYSMLNEIQDELPFENNKLMVCAENILLKEENKDLKQQINELKNKERENSNMNKLTILYKKVGRDPVVMEIEDTLDEKQKLVSGLIEVVPFHDDLIICNEEGKILDLPPNVEFDNDTIVGDFFIVGDDYKNAGFKSLSNENIENYTKYLKEHACVEPEKNKSIVKDMQR